MFPITIAELEDLKNEDSMAIHVGLISLEV